MIKLDDTFLSFSPHEQMILLHLLVGADDDGISKFSFRSLAVSCGVSVQVTRSTLSKLTRKGDVEVMSNTSGTFAILSRYDNYRVGKKKNSQPTSNIIVDLQAKCKKREKDFENSLIPFVSSRGGVYEPTMIRAFFNYWTEKNKSGTKMRFELEKTWETSKRLQTWASRDKPKANTTALNSDEMNYDKSNDW